MKTLFIVLVLSGCAARPPIPNCVNTIIDRKDVLSEARETKCECHCPTPTNVIETGGIIGGLLSLFTRD